MYVSGLLIGVVLLACNEVKASSACGVSSVACMYSSSLWDSGRRQGQALPLRCLDLLWELLCHGPVVRFSVGGRGLHVTASLQSSLQL